MKPDVIRFLIPKKYLASYIERYNFLIASFIERLPKPQNPYFTISLLYHKPFNKIICAENYISRSGLTFTQFYLKQNGSLKNVAGLYPVIRTIYYEDENTYLEKKKPIPAKLFRDIEKAKEYVKERILPKIPEKSLIIIDSWYIEVLEVAWDHIETVLLKPVPDLVQGNLYFWDVTDILSRFEDFIEPKMLVYKQNGCVVEETQRHLIIEHHTLSDINLYYSSIASYYSAHIIYTLRNAVAYAKDHETIELPKYRYYLVVHWTPRRVE